MVIMTGPHRSDYLSTPTICDLPDQPPQKGNEANREGCKSMRLVSPSHPHPVSPFMLHWPFAHNYAFSLSLAMPLLHPSYPCAPPQTLLYLAYTHTHTQNFTLLLSQLHSPSCTHVRFPQSSLHLPHVLCMLAHSRAPSVSLSTSPSHFCTLTTSLVTLSL